MSVRIGFILSWFMLGLDRSAVSRRLIKGLQFMPFRMLPRRDER